MASQNEQLGRKVRVMPADFSYPKGSWVVLPGLDEPALMHPSMEIEASVGADISRLGIKKNFVIYFDLIKSSSLYSWEGVDLSVKARVGERGISYSRSIQSQFMAMPHDVRTLVSAHFELDEEVKPSEDTLYFSLYELTYELKRGLLMYSATVDSSANVE